jgi:hypothetical protein
MIFLLIVTLSSMLLAVIMSVIAWRLAAAERRRSEARIAALSAEIHAPAAQAFAASSPLRNPVRRAEVGIRAEPARLTAVPQPRPAPRWDGDLPLRTAEPARPGGELFATAQQPASGRRFAFVALAIAAVAGVLVAVVLLRGGESAAAPVGAVQPATGDNRSAAPAQPAPLELVALGHERDGDRLIVRGVIRNSPAGPALDQVTAVVFAFNADGGFVTSARAELGAGALRSAGETTFAVNVPDAASASRYRVSFRSGDRIVPHVDRREPIKRP